MRNLQPESSFCGRLRLNENSLGRRCEAVENRLDELAIKLQRILFYYEKINQLQHNKLVEHDAQGDGDNEQQQLRNYQIEILHVEDFPGYDRGDAERAEPQAAEDDHFHYHLENRGEKVDDDLTFVADGAEDGAEGEAEEDDAERVGPGSIGNHSHHLVRLPQLPHRVRIYRD